MPFEKKGFPFLFVCCAIGLILASAGTATVLGLRAKQQREENCLLLRQALTIITEAQTSNQEHGKVLTQWKEERRQVRLAEEERLRLEEEERQRQAEEERIRLEEERKRQEAENERAERARRAGEKRRAAAEEAAQEMATIIAEQEKAAAETNYRATIAVKLREQEAAAKAENQAYLADPPEAVINLEVKATLQKPELPNGCEIASLQTLLAFKGITVDKTVLADEYLPQFPFYNSKLDGKTVRAGGDPNLYFAGNPRDNSNSYYCFAEPVVAAANQLLIDMGSDLTAIDMTGSDEIDLTNLLDLGEPIIVWGTLSMGDAFTYAPNAWVYDEQTGEKHIPFLNLHTVVLHGYDSTYFYLADPLRGNVAVDRLTFLNAYRQIGMRAVVIR